MGRPPSDLNDYLDWQQKLQQFKESGLTVEVFCQQEGVSRSTFHRWTNHLKAGIPESISAAAAQREKAESAEAVFMPITLKASPVEIELPNGGVVRLPLGVGQAAEAEQQAAELSRVLDETAASHEELKQEHAVTLDELAWYKRWTFGRRRERFTEGEGQGHLFELESSVVGCPNRPDFARHKNCGGARRSHSCGSAWALRSAIDLSFVSSVTCVGGPHLCAINLTHEGGRNLARLRRQNDTFDVPPVHSVTDHGLGNRATRC